MVQKNRAGSAVVAIRGRAWIVRTLARNAKTPSKALFRNFSIMKEPDGSDLLVNNLLPRLRRNIIILVKRCSWGDLDTLGGVAMETSLGS